MENKGKSGLSDKILDWGLSGHETSVDAFGDQSLVVRSVSPLSVPFDHGRMGLRVPMRQS